MKQRRISVRKAICIAIAIVGLAACLSIRPVREFIAYWGDRGPVELFYFQAH